jgi:hypothetical protein
MTERRFWAKFDEARPHSLGALLDQVVIALRNLPAVQDREHDLPRMADFAAWVVASDPDHAKEFLEAYAGRQAEASAAVLESYIFAEPLLRMLRTTPDHIWEGTSRKLLAELEKMVGENIPKKRDWPRNPRALTNSLRNLEPSLLSLGWRLTFSTKKARHGYKLIRLEPVEEPQPSEVGYLGTSGPPGTRTTKEAPSTQWPGAVINRFVSVRFPVTSYPGAMGAAGAVINRFVRFPVTSYPGAMGAAGAIIPRRKGSKKKLGWKSD